jgi:hypothetical protein
MKVGLPNTIACESSSLFQPRASMLSTEIRWVVAPRSRAPCAIASASTVVCPKREWYATLTMVLNTLAPLMLMADLVLRSPGPGQRHDELVE